jgi:hypothetical protein
VRGALPFFFSKQPDESGPATSGDEAQLADVVIARKTGPAGVGRRDLSAATAIAHEGFIGAGSSLAWVSLERVSVMAPRSEVELASGQTLERRHLHRLHVCILIVCSHALWRLNGETILHLTARR